MKKSPRQKSNRNASEPGGISRGVAQPAPRDLRVAQFRGPLPPPAVLEQYDHVLPGTAERILRMAEQEQAAGRDLASKVVEVTATETRRGQHFGFAAALAALSVTAFLGYLGHAFAAGVVGGTTVVGLSTVFAVGRRGVTPGQNNSA